MKLAMKLIANPLRIILLLKKHKCSGSTMLKNDKRLLNHSCGQLARDLESNSLSVGTAATIEKSIIKLFSIIDVAFVVSIQYNTVDTVVLIIVNISRTSSMNFTKL
jgi:hypothetical protein